MEPSSDSVDEAETSRAGAKRAAAPIPITAGAFNFLLGTPASKKLRQLGQPPFGLQKVSALAQLSNSESHVGTKDFGNAYETPRKPLLQTLDSLPSPLHFKRPYDTPQPGSTGKHKLNRVLDEVSPFRQDGTGHHDLREQLPGIQGMSDQITKLKRETEVKEMEEEGIGVSPRKARDARWQGKGPPPLGARLSTLLRTTESSLILFYSSLQRRLAPPRTPTAAMRQRQNGIVAMSEPTTVSHLVETATLLVRPLRLIPGPTHQAMMLECTLISWSKVDGGQRHPGGGQVAGDNLGENETTEEDNDRKTRLVVILQNLPHVCPRLGVDARVMVGRMKDSPADSQQSWKIGIWSPWTESLVQLGEESGGQGVMDIDPGGAGEEAKSTSLQVIFASRYLIVDDRDTVVTP